MFRLRTLALFTAFLLLSSAATAAEEEEHRRYNATLPPGWTAGTEEALTTYSSPDGKYSISYIVFGVEEGDEKLLVEQWAQKGSMRQLSGNRGYLCLDDSGERTWAMLTSKDGNFHRVSTNKRYDGLRDLLTKALEKEALRAGLDPEVLNWLMYAGADMKEEKPANHDKAAPRSSQGAGLKAAVPAVLSLPPQGLAAPVFHNTFTTAIAEVYGAAPGNAPWPLTGPMPGGKKAVMEDPSLRGCSRLIVKLSDTYALQFFTLSYLFDSETLTLELHRVKEGTAHDFPLLIVRKRGQEFPVPAGLPFHLLQGDMERDMMTKARWAEWMNPLDLKEATPEVATVSLADVSWDIAPGTADFAESAKGGQRLRAISLSAPVQGKTVSTLLGELESSGAQPLLFALEPGKALAFSKEALALDAKATPHKAMEREDPSERWEAFRQRFAELGEQGSSEGTTGLRLVFASESLIYDFKLSMGEPEAVLHMERR